MPIKPVSSVMANGSSNSMSPIFSFPNNVLNNIIEQSKIAGSQKLLKDIKAPEFTYKHITYFHTEMVDSNFM